MQPHLGSSFHLSFVTASLGYAAGRVNRQANRFGHRSSERVAGFPLTQCDKITVNHPICLEAAPPSLLEAMPVFYCPIAPAISPATAEAEARVLAWADRFELHEDARQREYLARARFPLFPARSMPDADPHGLTLAGKEVMWLQSFDDVHSDEKPGGTPLDEYVVLLAKLARILEEPRADLLPGNRWAAALRDLRLDVEAHATHAQLDRWVRAHIDYFDGLLWEAVNRAQGASPGIDDYIAMWLKQSGVYPCIAFTDLACGYEVPAADWHDPRVRMLREMTAAIIGWDNDLTSYNKEALRAEQYGFPAIQNLVAVIAEARECSVGEAVGLVSAMRNHAMARFVALRDRVSADGDPATTRYVHGLAQWIRGYLDYSALSPRYLQPSSAFEHVLAHGWPISETQPDDGQAKLPAPASLAGWW